MNHLSSRWLKSTPLKTAVLQSKVTRADWKVLTCENCSLAIKGNNISASSSLLFKFGSLKTLRRATISRRPSTCMWVHLQVYLMLPLRISGTTSRQACSIQLRKCVAQLSPSAGVVKPGGGKRMWNRPLLPSRKLSRPGRLLKALGHHMMQPMHCQTCSAPCQSRSWQEGLWEYCPKSLEVYHLDNQFRREDADVIDSWQTSKEWCRGDINEWRLQAEGLVRALPKASQHSVQLGPRPPVWQTPLEGPPIPITTDMVEIAISQMKAVKASSPSGIVVEMIGATGRLHDPWPCSCNHLRWQGTLRLGAVFHCLPLQG